MGTEEHLTVTQFKVEREQARLAGLTKKTEQIEAKPVSLFFKVMQKRAEYEALATATKKYITQEKKESKLQKMMDAANKLIEELKAKVASLAKELSEYKSVRGRLQAAELEQENKALRNKLHSYEPVIERNDLWRYFARHRANTSVRDETR